jgi:hypothetical protein
MKNAIMLFLLIILSTCSTKIINKIKREYIEIKEPIDIKIIEKALNFDEGLKSFLHYEIKTRNELFFYSEQPFYPKEAPYISIFDNKVLILNQEDVLNQSNIIKLSVVLKDGEELKLLFLYDIEGVLITVNFKKVLYPTVFNHLIMRALWGFYNNSVSEKLKNG